MSGTPTFRIGLRHFDVADGQSRSLLLDRKSFKPSIVGSIYEASLSRRFASPNTLDSYLRCAQSLISWALEEDFNLDARLLSGKALEKPEIERFSQWVEKGLLNKHGKLSRAAINTYNSRIQGAETMVRWFIDMYFDGRSHSLPRGAIIEGVLATSGRAWSNATKRRVSDDAAPDLEEETISEIETFLKNASQASKPEPRWVRAYLIWRLAIEFGFRIGEILGLRLEDCPTRIDPAFRIVRISDRNGPLDPRSRLAPRPKTLPRELAPILSNTAFPHLVVDYQIDHRLRHVLRPNGEKTFRPILSHQYLIVSNGGKPLPRSTASSFARAISAEIGKPFTWHLARHAFFNRAYSAIAQIEDASVRNLRLDDLVYWGGWEDPDSLNIYNKRDRQNRAKSALILWGKQQQRWDALG